MSTASWISWLDAPSAATAGDDQPLAVVGGKAANLGRLRHLGFPVPPGFVVTTAAYRAFLAADDLAQLATTDPVALYERIPQVPLPEELSAAIVGAYRQLGGGAVAVRSSGTAEDLATASFAGQHDTFLNVTGSDALLDAVRACWASLWTSRAIAYRQERGGQRTADGLPVALAVVVQVMVPAAVAGVAFTANPITGDRGEVTISAVRGLGEQLVSGEARADEWVVRGEGASAVATCVRDSEGALTAAHVQAVADLARRIAGHFGAPQDVEWAIADGTLFVLQARPMTALPAPAPSAQPTEPIRWTAPAGGGWMRNFRLGEWLPEPVTPLCDSWLLTRLEAGEVAAEARDFGVSPRPPHHVLAHGWYFSSPIGSGVPLRGVVTAVTRHPRALLALARSTRRPDLAERSLVGPVAQRWRSELLPQYQLVVATWKTRVEAATPTELCHAIDAIADVAGAYLWDFSIVGGHAWKAEHALARYCRRHLPERAAQGHQALLLGLPVPHPAAAAHAVQSLDWMRPTLGETYPETPADPDLDQRRARLGDARRAAEVACRVALAGRTRQRQRFDALLALAQRYAVLREEQAWWFTLGWPVLRRAVLRLGDELQRREAITHREDIFFLMRAEVEAVLGAQRDNEPGHQTALQMVHQPAATDYREVVATRRRMCDEQRRLTPPLVLGNPLGARVIARATEAMRAAAVPTGAEDRGGGRVAPTILSGMPASPGRATGAVRIVRGPDDFARFQPGEVLVAQVTAPAWTPLFRRAAAIVTDGGSLAAHASLVAREYGIPAVVAVGDASARLRDGQRVEVDGDRGSVELLDATADGTAAS